MMDGSARGGLKYGVFAGEMKRIWAVEKPPDRCFEN